jgi:hypothetical protein
MAKARYSKPASQLDLEARQKEDYVPPTARTQAEDPGKSENGYIGVAAEYQNFANETEAPIKVEKGAEAKVLSNFVSDDADYKAGATPEGESDTEDDEEEASGSTTAPSTPSTVNTPPSQ